MSVILSPHLLSLPTGTGCGLGAMSVSLKRLNSGDSAGLITSVITVVAEQNEQDDQHGDGCAGEVRPFKVTG